MIELTVWLLVLFVGNGLGLFVYFNNPRSITNKAFALVAFSISFWSTIMYWSLAVENPDTMFFLIRLSMLAAGTLTTSILFLAFVFPEQKLTVSYYLLIPVLAIAMLNGIVAMSPYMFTELIIQDGNVEPVPGPGLLLFLIPGLGYAVWSLIIFIRKYFKSRGSQKAQIRYVLLGLLAMLFLLVLTNFVFVILFKSSAFVPLGPLFTLTFLGGAAYAIVRHRLLEIRLLVARAVTFFLLLLTIVGVLASLLLTLPLLLPEDYHSPATILAAILLAFAFNPVRHSLERTTERILHKRSYDPDLLLEQLGEDLRSSVSLNNLSSKLMKRFHTTIRPSKAAFIVLDDDEKITIKNFDFDPVPDLDVKQIKYLARHCGDGILVYEESENDKVRELMLNNDMAVVVPLRANKVLHGLFVLGSKSSGEIYNSQDLHLLELFGPQLSVGVQNALAYDEIKSFNVTLRQKVKDATADLRKANKHLRELDKLKDEFVYIATHELKTPVTVIKGYASMIEEGTYGELPNKLKEPLKEIESASQQLQLLVNDLLDIARSESASLSVETKPTDLNKVIKDTISNVNTLAEEKGLKIVYGESSPVMIQGDANRLKEVMNNLVSNAIKYSTKGTIEITHTHDKSQIVTHVKDQGHGIDESDHKKVFSRFFRAEDVSSTAPGTGLGLFIVKQLIEKMGGRIWFSSKLNHGSTFSYSLPKAG